MLLKLENKPTLRYEQIYKTEHNKNKALSEFHYLPTTWHIFSLSQPVEPNAKTAGLVTERARSGKSWIVGGVTDKSTLWRVTEDQVPRARSSFPESATHFVFVPTSG